MKKVALSKMKDDLSRFLRQAEGEEIVITRHGKPAGLLIGFRSEDDWFDYRLEHDPRFLRRIDAARSSLRDGSGIPFHQIVSEVKTMRQVRRNPGSHSRSSGRRHSLPRARRRNTTIHD